MNQTILGPSSEYDDLWDRPGFLIRRLHQIHVGLFAEEFSECDLTAVQYAVLSILEKNSGLDQLSLSMAVGVDRVSGADVIRRLVGRGLVSRQVSKTDRRAKIVEITRAGRAMVRNLRPAMQRAQERLIAPLTIKERKYFLDILYRLIEANNDASRAPMT
ncbi:MarR family winged helix-turn-helix transcriptional regulator [Dongia sp.]|uniref:MarR family winged helix-turn-helix transcriptional regulator n=1 Tax=Dongia sp. TaxID=1977262 RepID=UPI0037534E4D